MPAATAQAVQFKQRLTNEKDATAGLISCIELNEVALTCNQSPVTRINLAMATPVGGSGRGMVISQSGPTNEEPARRRSGGIL